MENHPFYGKIHYKLSFSIAMLGYQRVKSVTSLPNEANDRLANLVIADPLSQDSEPYYLSGFHTTAPAAPSSVYVSLSGAILHLNKMWFVMFSPFEIAKIEMQIPSSRQNPFTVGCIRLYKIWYLVLLSHDTTIMIVKSFNLIRAFNGVNMCKLYIPHVPWYLCPTGYHILG